MIRQINLSDDLEGMSNLLRVEDNKDISFPIMCFHNDGVSKPMPTPIGKVPIYYVPQLSFTDYCNWAQEDVVEKILERGKEYIVTSRV